MKKIIFCALTSLLLCNSIVAQTQTKQAPVSASMMTGKPNESAKAAVLLARLDKINAMDKSALTATEKKQLRKEVRTIKSTLHDLNDGVYLSVGAIIIILLLLILLL